MSWNVALLIAVLVSASPNLSAKRGGVASFGHAIAHPGFGMRATQPARWTHRAGGGDYYRYSDFGWSDLSYPYYSDYWNSSRYADDGSPSSPSRLSSCRSRWRPSRCLLPYPLRPQVCTSTRGRIPAVMALPLLRLFPKMGQSNVQPQSGSRATAYALSRRRVSAGS